MKAISSLNVMTRNNLGIILESSYSVLLFYNEITRYYYFRIKLLGIILELV